MVVEIDGVALHLAHPDELPVSWVGKIFYTEDARIETVRIWPVNFEAGTTQFARGFEELARCKEIGMVGISFHTRVFLKGFT